VTEEEVMEDGRRKPRGERRHSMRDIKEADEEKKIQETRVNNKC
jgi:hypothetical protein